jgi:hypothetical protein
MAKAIKIQIIPPMNIESYHFSPNVNTSKFDRNNPEIFPALA